MSSKAIIFDYIGTLVNCRNYTMEASKLKLHQALKSEGFEIAEDIFLEAYDNAHEKYRKVRYEQLQEVTNAIWVAEALSNLGFNVSPKDARVMAALNVFFEDFINTLEARNGAKKLLKQAKQHGKVGLISNFTYAPVIYKSLRKVGLADFFSVVVVSQEVGWRKPSARIFQDALSRLGIKACEAAYVGDSPNEDIKGAKVAGLKTVFVSSQFNSLKNLEESKHEPDYVSKDLNSLCQKLPEIASF